MHKTFNKSLLSELKPQILVLSFTLRLNWLIRFFLVCLINTFWGIGWYALSIFVCVCIYICVCVCVCVCVHMYIYMYVAAMWDTWVWSLGWEGPLEKDMETHSSTLAWKISWAGEPGRLQLMGSQRVGHDWAISLFFHT